jgi:Mor family transcriptional regulator
MTTLNDRIINDYKHGVNIKLLSVAYDMPGYKISRIVNPIKTKVISIINSTIINRDQSIINDYLTGMSVPDIVIDYAMTCGNVYYFLKKYKVYKLYVPTKQKIQ